MSSPEFLSTLLRLHFGASASFHFLFVPLSIGLLLYVNVLQTLAIVQNNALLDQASRYWRRFFALAWSIGLCTGYPLRFQLQTNWGHYTEATRPVLEWIFGIEGAIAPFMLASVLVLLLGRRLVGRHLHLLCGWMLLALLCVQAWTILSINAWMQHPVGVQLLPGRVLLESPLAILFSDTTLNKVWHTLSAALVCGSFFIMAASAGFILRKQHLDMSLRSLNLACWLGLAGVLSTAWSGHQSTADVARVQPMKFAAMEGLWRKETGSAGLVLFGIPQPQSFSNAHEVKVPHLMSMLLGEMRDGPQGITDLIERDRRDLLKLELTTESLATTRWADLAQQLQQRAPVEWAGASRAQRAQWLAQETVPPVTPVFTGFRVMVALGAVQLLCCLLGATSIHRIRLGGRRWVLHIMRWSLPLPWLAILCGWMVAEVGRQPWVIYGHLSTHGALTAPSENAAFVQVAGMALGFIALSFLTVWATRSISEAGPHCENWPRTAFYFLRNQVTTRQTD